MGRWEPNTRRRLVLAALDLFAAQGYDAVSVAQIAERAGVSKMTFFRHFPDKREVLFAGQELHGRLLADAIAAAPAGATPLAAVGAALDAATAAFTPEQRDFGPRLLAVIAASGELRERAAYKRASLAAAMAAALRERGVAGPSADLAAELGARAFYQAFERWVEPGSGESYGELARHALDELRAAAATLG
jgi:AcrR family transcriptional regulator